MHIIQKTLKIPSRGYKKILSHLHEKGGQARLIGGCVRDALLNKDSYDIDIATSLLPEEVIRILSKAQIKVIPTGLKFGTVTAILDKEYFEITTLRKDIDCNGRHAKVLFASNFAGDAARRDFTINALSYCPFKNEIYDYFDGLSDLEQKKVIFIGIPTERIKEDYLRILRFFRFSSYYADHIDIAGLKACENLKEGLNILSRERIKSEMDRIIVSKNASSVLSVMFEVGILQMIFPGLLYLDASDDNKASYAYVSKEPIIQYALLFRKIADLRFSTLINWKYSRYEATKILAIIHFINLSKITILEINKIWLAELDYKEYLFAAQAVGKLTPLQTQEFIDKYDKLPRLKFPVTGHDLLKLNIESKAIGVELEYLKNIWLENDFKPTKKQLLSYIKNHD